MVDRVGLQLDNYRHNLPAQLTPLIGREQEVTAVDTLLRHPEVRLLTLMGPGGVGKTRLGLEVAAELLDDYPDGVCFVPLATISDPELVVPTIAQVLGIKEAGEQPVANLLQASLQDKRLLLLLDNFEQVTAAAPRLADLLADCPQLKILVTSRAVLHIRGEHEFLVPPLALPDLTRLPESESLLQYAAVALFLHCARAARPDFQVTPANTRVIAEICVRLDGLPLAIELAAARVKLLPPQALLTRLAHRLQVLTSGARDAPVRQQTLRNTLAWSYDLLDAEEQRLFRRLSVFAGGCTLEAVEGLSTALGDTSADVLDGVASLMDKSLLRLVEQEGEEPRLLMLATIREYGLEVLASSGEMESTQRAHAAYYLALAEQAELELRGPQQGAWLERLEREHDNLRAALSWSLEPARDEEGEQSTVDGREIALRLAGALWTFWWARGHRSEGRTFLERALAAREGIEASSIGAKALHAAAHLAFVQSDYERAETLFEGSLELYRELGDQWGFARSLSLLGSVAWVRNNTAAARSMTEEAFALSRELGFKEGIAAARCLFGQLALGQGDLATAHSQVEESVTLYKEMGHRYGTAESLAVLGKVVAAQGDYASARRLYEESLALSGELGEKWVIATCLLGLGEVVAAQRQLAWAAQLWGAADALRDALGVPIQPVELADYERSLSAARVHLGERAFAAAWAQGRSMTPEQALAAKG